MRYYISDLHFWHEKLISKMDNRCFESVEAMNAYMIKQWNSRIKNNDDVVILGDFSWGTPNQTTEIIEALNGRLHLIAGNHDQVDNKKYDFSRFRWIKDYAELYDERRRVVLSHYPIMCYNGQYREDEKGNPKTYMLYGHVHDTRDQRLVEQYISSVRSTRMVSISGEEKTIPCNMINCFCMYSDYVPLTLDEWILNHNERMRKLGRNDCLCTLGSK